MEYYPVPQEQKTSRSKPLYRNGFIISLLAVSLSLNFYFFSEKSEQFFNEEKSGLSEIDFADDVNASVPKTFTQGRPSPAKIEKASFSKPEKPGNGTIRVLHFNVENSINHTLCKSMPKDECGLMTAYVGRILGWHFDLNKYLRKGDSGFLIFKYIAGDARLRILKLRYHSKYLGKTLEINYFKIPGAEFGSYFDNDGTETAARISQQQSPVRDYIEITSLPGDFRKGASAGHSGTDFKAPVGAPVFSSFDGQVTRTNWNRRMNGYCVEIDHPREKIKTLYLHLNKVLVLPGAKVRQGQQIAESGNTGRSFAPHLHFEIQNRGKKKIIYNPFKLKIYKTHNEKISAGIMPAFKNTLKTYDTHIQQG